MPISGLVLTLPDDPEVSARVRSALDAMPQVTVGPPSGVRLPIVVDSPSVAADRDTFCAIQDLPGVQMVELAFVDFSDVERLASREKRRMGRRHRQHTDSRNR